MSEKIYQFDMRVEVHGQNSVTDARDYVQHAQCDGVLVVGTPKLVTDKKKPGAPKPLKDKDLAAIEKELVRRFGKIKSLPTPEQVAALVRDYLKELPLMTAIPLKE